MRRILQRLRSTAPCALSLKSNTPQMLLPLKQRLLPQRLPLPLHWLPPRLLPMRSGLQPLRLLPKPRRSWTS